jgi:hypothetical protein
MTQWQSERENNGAVDGLKGAKLARIEIKEFNKKKEL